MRIYAGRSVAMKVIGIPWTGLSIASSSAKPSASILPATIEIDGGMLPGVLYDAGLKTITDLL